MTDVERQVEKGHEKLLFKNNSLLLVIKAQKNSYITF